MTTHPIDLLFATIDARKNADPKQSYTAKLLAQGKLKCAKKLAEEAVETALAAAAQDKTALVNESADLLYHLLVLWAACGLTPDNVYAALMAREGRSGLEEKASRAT
jgi:phosphoribosyl-ATP pyrophosphohydrolase